MKLLLLISFLLILFTCSQTQTPASAEFPYPFMTVNAEEASARTYDYIIVGGGTAGCPLAATLSQNYSVLVVERGGSPYGNPDIENAEALGKAMREANKYTSIAQGFVSEDGVLLHRARVLGGGTAINGGFYSRASLEYIRRMEWDEKVVNQSYEWVEKQLAFKPDKLFLWNSAFKDALLEAGELPYNGYTVDHVEGTKISASTFDNNRKRHTAADFLMNANPKNIVVLLNATVSRILFHSASGKLKAHGVEFINSVNGRAAHQALLNEISCCSEVVLSAGSIGSPQLLLLSGIGPSQHLKQFNISVLLDFPSVGQGVQDNPSSVISIQSPVTLKISSIQVAAILFDSQVYIESLTAVQSVALNHTVSSTSPQTKKQYIGSFVEKIAFPLSRGHLRLSNRDPRDNPSVRYNYYSHPQDLATCVQAVMVIDKLSQTPPIKHFAVKKKSNNKRELQFVGQALPKDKSLINFAKFCQNTLTTIWHFHGGCHVGSVIDHSYRVKGVNGVRIVDGSTFQDIPGTNPQATTMMLGRYIGMKIIEERISRSKEKIRGERVH